MTIWLRRVSGGLKLALSRKRETETFLEVKKGLHWRKAMDFKILSGMTFCVLTDRISDLRMFWVFHILEPPREGWRKGGGR